MPNTQIVMREVGGATIATLLYPAWPVVWTPPPVVGHTLAGQPVVQRRRVATLHYAYTPADLMQQLKGLPTDREVQVWLPKETGVSGGLVAWAWFQGWWAGLAEAYQQRGQSEWAESAWQFVGAVEV